MKEITLLLAQALEVYAGKAPANAEAVMPIYLQVLGEIPADLARQALWNTIKHCKFWPLPADILESVQEEVDIRQAAPGSDRLMKWRSKRFVEAGINVHDKRLETWRVDTVEKVEAMIAAHAAGPEAYAAELERQCPARSEAPPPPPARESVRLGVAEILASHRRKATGIEDKSEAEKVFNSMSRDSQKQYWEQAMARPK